MRGGRASDLKLETSNLKLSYTLLSPFYDLVVGPALASARARSLSALPSKGGLSVLISGIGTGLDLPHLPPAHRYVGLDLTPAMLARATWRRAGLDLALVQGNSQRLPFADASFDCAVLHLILAVVPDGARALAETARVVRSSGSILVFDKFLRRGEPDEPVLRLFSPFAACIVTRLDVEFEALLERVPELRLVSDEPALFGGWFRLIRLEKL